MSLAMRAVAARINRGTLLVALREIAREYNAVMEDDDLAPDGKAKRAVPIRARFEARYNAMRETTVGLLVAAQRDYLAVQPRKQHRAAVLKDPMRAVALRELYADATVAELRELAALAVVPGKDADPLLGFVVGAIVSRRRENITEAERADIIALTNAETSDATRDALADYVVAQAELQRMDFDVADILGELPDPVTRMTAARRMYDVDAGDGERRTLKESEFTAMYDRAKVPMANPPEWGEPVALSVPSIERARQQEAAAREAAQLEAVA